MLARALLLSLCLCASATAQQNAEWRQPFPAFKIIGNVYWVGTYDLSTYLITTDAGHILINTGFEDTVPLIAQGCRVIDLSADFRLKDAAVYKEFYAHDHPAPELLGKAVYGLTEIHRATLKDAALVASPGCYPTSILLPIIPLLRAGLIQPALFADELHPHPLEQPRVLHVPGEQPHEIERRHLACRQTLSRNRRFNELLEVLDGRFRSNHRFAHTRTPRPDRVQGAFR